MEFNDIEKLIEKIAKTNISCVELEYENLKLKVEKQLSNSGEVKPVLVNEYQQVQNSIEEIEVEDNNLKVKSPMVGTFYKSASEDSAPFVSVGDKVKKGDTLCILEAMKLMNEIESECDGEIIEILARNEQMVEFGQVMFKIKEC